MRKRALIVLLFPLVVIPWFIGWTLLRIDDQLSAHDKKPQETIDRRLRQH